jgi:hypothetical protein
MSDFAPRTSASGHTDLNFARISSNVLSIDVEIKVLPLGTDRVRPAAGD